LREGIVEISFVHFAPTTDDGKDVCACRQTKVRNLQKQMDNADNDAGVVK